MKSTNTTLFTACLLSLLTLMLIPTVVFAQDKSGVKPQVISLPSGPGSLEGLGETFEPDLSSGTSSYPVKFTAAPGRVGFQPELSLNYNGGNANGAWGMGWKISIPSIQRRTENGLPSYVDSQDQFIYSDGEKLVPLTDGTYRLENGNGALRFRRMGEGWEVNSADGMRYIFGEDANSRVIIDKGIFRWELTRVSDTHGNELRYSYLHDGGTAYPREIRYNGFNGVPNSTYNAVIFNYEARPDTFTDRRSGAPLFVGLRGTDIQMWAQGKLVRAYTFGYEPERSTGVYSLLTSVRQVGDDGTSMLPPHSFTYTQFDASQHQVVIMQNPPPLGLINRDVDLVDTNADGLPDIVYTPAEGGHRFYLNRGRGRWQTEPVYPAQSPAERLSNPNTRMADMNGDGRVDLLVKAGTTANSPFYFYQNRSDGEWEKTSRVDFGPSPSFDLNDPNVQLIDVNNDHRIDVVLTDGGRLKVWLARENAWSQNADFDVPAPAAGDSAKFSDPNIKVGDITGDRMEDLLFVRDGLVIFWAHNGNGSYDEGAPLINPPSGVGTQSAQIQAGDINNDGLVDLVLPGNRTVHYWLTLGNGKLTDPIVLTDTPAFDAQNTGVRLADVDGDGAVELLYSRYPAQANEAMQYVDFSVGAQPFLLKSVDNGLGRTIHIDYKSSIEDHIADWDAGTPWNVNLPFPVQVVRQVKVHDANSGDDYVIDYHYRDGYYDGVQKEFRGFVRSEEIRQGDLTAATTVTRLVYDVGMTDESRKGMLLEKEVLLPGGKCAGDFKGCYQRQVNQLTTHVVIEAGKTQTGKTIAYAYTSQSDSFIHEQTAQPVQLRQSFEQDSYGNVLKQFNFGIVCGQDVTCGNDEILTYHEFIYNTTEWLLNRSQRSYQTDASGNFVSETRFYYDGAPFVGAPLGVAAKGDLVREEKNLGPKGGNRWINTKRYQVDPFGNQVAIMDGNGNRITVEYDPVAFTFPVVERRHFADGQTLTYVASYHPGFGQPVSATDYNGHPHIFTFDTFGRLATMVKPGDTLEKPTEQYSYAVGAPRNSVTTKKRIRSGEDAMITSVSYTDGLGRKLQTRSDAGNGKVVVTEATSFNARQGVAATFLPYFSDGYEYVAPDPALPHSRMFYDGMGRVIRTTDPEGTFVMVLHKPLVQELYDEEDTNQYAPAPFSQTPQIVTYDGLGRVIQVEEIRTLPTSSERQRYVSRYEYDRLGNLIKLTDAQNNVKTMEYDALGRRLRMVDPNRGEMIYSYDDNSNLVKTRDAKAQEVIYSYDAANRLLNERWVFTNGQADVVNAVYHYDGDLSPLHSTARNTLGQIAYVEDQAGKVYFSYDPRGNMVGSIRQYAGEERSFVGRRVYDAMDRLIRTTYADGSHVSYEYDVRGLLTRIPGFIEQVTYTASGQRASITYANGATTNYTYDLRQRLNKLQTQTDSTLLQEFTYNLDNVGNVKGIVDGRPNKTATNDQSQNFAYDSLYRLLNASGTYGQIDYGYDSIGNLVSKTSSSVPGQNVGELRYGENGAGPHAMTSAKGISYSYDANGNLARKGNTTYLWNPRDMLVAADDGSTVSSYQYDTSGKRVTQSVRQGGVITTTLYPDGASEVRGNQLILYIFDDETRMAEVVKPLDSSPLLKGFDDEVTIVQPPAIAKRWYINDHLGSTHLLLDEAAQVISEKVYYPFGQNRHAVNGAASAYDYTGKELDASGLHYYEARYYDSEIGRFISTDPLYSDKPQDGLQNPQLLNLYAYTLNNPIKYVDPDGANPENKFMIIGKQGTHGRMAVLFEAPVQDWAFDATSRLQKGIPVQARMTIFTQRGDKWTPMGQSTPVTLRFTALPNSPIYIGEQYKQVWKQHTVKATGAGIGNNYLMAYRASGGQHRTMEQRAMLGTFQLVGGDGKAGAPLEVTSAIGTGTTAPYHYSQEVGSRTPMPAKTGIGFGVGVTDGKDPESASHIIGGPTIGDLKIDGSNLKVQESPH